MKKNLFFVALAAVALASCSNEDLLVDDVETTDSPAEIGFTTYTEAQTRAENSSQEAVWNLEDHHTTFDVWSNKYVATNWIAVHGTGVDENAGMVVTWNTPTANAWNPANPKYWDKSATKYIFYAAAPSSANWKIQSASADAAYLKYSSFALTGDNLSTSAIKTYQNSWLQAANDKDLMIATDNTVANASYNKATPDVVDLKFNHILSRLNVTVKRGTNLSTNNADLDITDLEVVGLKSVGNFDESKASESTDPKLSAGTTARWTGLTTDYTLTGVNDENLTATAVYSLQALVIPQTAGVESVNRDGTTATYTEPYLVIKYTIDGEAYQAYYNLATAFNTESPAAVAFNEGWQNTLNITIDASLIEFDAEVYQWADKATGALDVK